MIKSDFSSVFCAKTIAAFQGQFDLGIEALDNTAGVAIDGMKVVEQKGAVSLQGVGDFFERDEA
jgi:hypothetical protein